MRIREKSWLELMKINNNRENQDLVVFHAITVYNTGKNAKVRYLVQCILEW